MTPIHTTTRSAWRLSGLAAALMTASTLAQAVLVTSSGPLSVPAGTPGGEPNSLLTSLIPNLVIQNYWDAGSSMNVFLGTAGGDLVYRNAVPSGTDVGSLSFSFPATATFGMRLADRFFDANTASWTSTALDGGLVLGQAHNFYAFRVNNGTNDMYGWIDLQVSDVGTSSGFSLTINAWAYDDSGASVTVPSIAAVPEPGTLALWAAGVALLAGVGVRRGARKAA